MSAASEIERAREVLRTQVERPSKFGVAEIRAMFLAYFKALSHTYVHSSPVVPYQDPTLLFANAGMNQFKAIFTGKVSPLSPMAKLTRAVNSQKCIRAGGKHNDLDDVGKDSYHHTFFEMLGNWSFGDFFKRESIGFAFLLLTEGFGLDPKRMYATYFAGDAEMGIDADEESRLLWLSYLPEAQVLPFDRKDNFWEMGDVGPCGPCTEIHYDMLGRDTSIGASLVNQDDPTLIEIWNLVFIQFDRVEKGGIPQRLPACHVDTGLGLERLAAILQGASSNYTTDAFAPLFDAIRALNPTLPIYSDLYGSEDVGGVSMAYRVVADHMRTLTVAIADGARPGAVGRGYVLRRVLRRAVHFGVQKLGFPAKTPFLWRLVSSVVDLLGSAFPELVAARADVEGVVRDEEAKFSVTLEKGKKHFDKMVTSLRKAGGVNELPGDVVFTLYDRYGYPADLSQIMAEEIGLTVDLTGFASLMHTKALADRSLRGVAADGVSLMLTSEARAQLQTNEVNITDDTAKHIEGELEVEVVALWDGKELATVVGGAQSVSAIFNRTNFYAEAGGQQYDQGELRAGGAVFSVDNVQNDGGYVLHMLEVPVGEVLHVGDKLLATVNPERREALARNHTGTHALNHALRAVLGAQVQQKGSKVLPERLRFDFNHSSACFADEIEAIETAMNGMVTAGLDVYCGEASLEVARGIAGLQSVFDEHYPDPVRVVSIGVPIEALLDDPSNPKWRNFAIEFCGGTHVANTTSLKHLIVVAEDPLSVGIRRITVVSGPEAASAQLKLSAFADKYDELCRSEQNLAARLAAIKALKVEIGEEELPYVGQKRLLDTLTQAAKAVAKQISNAEAELKLRAKGEIDGFKKELSEDVKGLVAVLEHGGTRKAVFDATKQLEKCCKPVCLVTVSDSEIFICARSPKGNLHCGEWIKAINGSYGGKGGGRDIQAQSSSTHLDQIDSALATARSFLAEHAS